MGKKGTKRKTKWRALPLGEDAGGSGNEEEVLDEDQSTISSLAGQPACYFKRQTTYFKASEKSYRQTKRFPFDRFRTKEPLVKLESKTFDEEEYTKITTPRQDVLFKKGCFGRKRESSVEEVTRQAEDTDMDGEEPMMDQIIITNGFVDERGHYLVNGNSYEIYDPYSNTVTVVVGPPPYANGVTQPVLAAVSCQPVPLQPVDWYPPGSDWPSQGSAWTPSFRRGLETNPPTALGGEGDQVSEPGAPNPYDRSSYSVPELAYEEPRNFKGSTEETNNSRLGEETSVAEDHPWERDLRKSKGSLAEEKEEIKEKEEEMESKPIDEGKVCKSSIPESEPEEQSKKSLPNFPVVEEKQVEKKSHSTQTISPERDHGQPEIPGKESHSTQTPPEDIFSSNKAPLDKLRDKTVSYKTNNDIRGKVIEETSPNRKFYQNRYKEQKSPFKREHESYPKKTYQQRKNFAEDKTARVENYEQLEIDKDHNSSLPISYAKKALMGLENGGQSHSKPGNTSISPSLGSNQANKTKPNLSLSTNGTNSDYYNKQTRYKDNIHSLDEKRNGQMKNGYVKCKFERGSSEGKAVNGKSYSRDVRVKETKFQKQSFEQEKKPEDSFSESRSPSEKSSLVSGLSSPTELSSGQTTPPEKLIIKKLEEKIACEINQSVQQKLKHNLEGESEKEENSGESKIEEESVNGNVKSEEGKKKKNKGKSGEGKKPTKPSRESKSKKKKKKAKEKPESDTASSEELPFFLEENPGMRLFNAWDNHKNLISDAPSFEKEDEEILKSFGIKEDRARFSKLPLHSDLLMMLPSFGWGRPKLRIEDFFAPTHFHNDLYTKRNITNMKSTKPEEFFASVVDGTTPAEEKKKDAFKVEDKYQTKVQKGKSTKEPGAKAKKNSVKTESKACKKEQESKSPNVLPSKTEAETKGAKLGITEAVNSWLQEQGDPEKVLSLEKLPKEASECVTTTDPLRLVPDAPPKNDEGNPIRASSGNAGRRADAAPTREPDGCIRVANVVNDGFILLDKEFLWKQRSAKKNRMYRSSSWDAKLSDPKAKSRFKFLTDSASFCQDLISDVRNGLPAKNEYATEELCDPKQSVSKYYTLAPGSLPIKSKSVQESDSDNEVFDALEYKFLTKENLEKRGSDGKSAKDSGNASITDSGVHSDVESSEDSSNDHLKEAACKLQ